MRCGDVMVEEEEEGEGGERERERKRNYAHTQAREGKVRAITTLHTTIPSFPPPPHSPRSFQHPLGHTNYGLLVTTMTTASRRKE